MGNRKKHSVRHSSAHLGLQVVIHKMPIHKPKVLSDG